MMILRGLHTQVQGLTHNQLYSMPLILNVETGIEIPRSAPGRTVKCVMILWLNEVGSMSLNDRTVGR